MSDELRNRVQALADKWHKDAIDTGFAMDSSANELFDLLDAVPAAPVPAIPPGETGWLIEVQGAPQPLWLRVNGSATTEANEAIRFCRKVDADGFLEVFLSAKFGDDVAGIYRRRLSVGTYVVTEHMWIAAAPQSPVPQDVKDAEGPMISRKAVHSIVAGALYDFMGMLTGQDKEIILSAQHNALPAIDAIREFSQKRGLSTEDAAVLSWHAAIAAQDAGKGETK